MFRINPLTVRNITLNVTGGATHIVSSVAIQKVIEKVFPNLIPHPMEIFVVMNKNETAEIVKWYAKQVGLAIAISLVAGAVASVVTNQIDMRLFPDLSDATLWTPE